MNGVFGNCFRATGVGAVPGAGAADVGLRLRLLPRPRRGPLRTVRLRVLVSRPLPAECRVSDCSVRSVVNSRRLVFQNSSHWTPGLFSTYIYKGFSQF